MLIQFTLSQNVVAFVICLLKHVHHILFFFFFQNWNHCIFPGKFRLAKLNPDKIFLKKKVIGVIYLNQIARVRQDVMNFESF